MIEHFINREDYAALFCIALCAVRIIVLVFAKEEE